MEGSFALFIRLFILIGVKIYHTLWSKTISSISSFLSFVYRPTMLVHSGVKQLMDDLTVCHHDKKTIGLVILTRFPIPETHLLRSPRDGDRDPLHSSLTHPHLLERILVELTCHTVASWLSFNKLYSQIVPNVFLVYRKSVNSVFQLTSWLSTLPNHSMASVWYKTRKDSEYRLEHRKLIEDRIMHILSSAGYSANHRPSWEHPSCYYSLDSLEKAGDTTFVKNILPDLGDRYQASILEQRSPTVEYVTIADVDFSGLLEVALLAAIRSGSDYVIVLNPRAFGLRPDHIKTAVQLLTSSVDVVFGVSTNCSTPSGQLTESTDVRSPCSSELMGVYLFGIRGGSSLLLHVHTLASSVEWSSSITASRLWANLHRLPDTWTIACLRERLKELMYPVDLLALEQHCGIPPEQLVQDVITVIIPVGPGHPDDSLDLIEDFELVDVDRSKALANTLDILVNNATDQRTIQIILIDSGSTSSYRPSISSTENIRRFRGIVMRPNITLSIRRFHHPNPNQPVLPRRGELIRYAVDHFADGSILLFVEPGAHLPQHWDAFVYQCLQRPGVGMGCFAYRLHLHDTYIEGKSVSWAINCWLANYFVNLQTHHTEIPIVGQPLFIYTHYLACLGGYPKSSRALHPIDLALKCREHLGHVVVTCPTYASAGIPAEFAFRHGAYHTTLYTVSVAIARYLGASETELRRALRSE